MVYIRILKIFGRFTVSSKYKTIFRIFYAIVCVSKHASGAFETPWAKVKYAFVDFWAKKGQKIIVFDSCDNMSSSCSYNGFWIIHTVILTVAFFPEKYLEQAHSKHLLHALYCSAGFAMLHVPNCSSVSGSRYSHSYNISEMHLTKRCWISAFPVNSSSALRTTNSTIKVGPCKRFSHWQNGS